MKTNLNAETRHRRKLRRRLNRGTVLTQRGRNLNTSLMVTQCGRTLNPALVVMVERPGHQPFYVHTEMLDALR